MALATTVQQGQRFTAADLRVTTVGGGAGQGAMPAANLSGLIGQYAVTGLAAGTLLTQADVTPRRIPVPDQVQIPVQVKTGKLPASKLMPGSRVLVTVPDLATKIGAIVADTTAAHAGKLTVDLLVPSRYASTVARQAAAATPSLKLLPSPTPSR